MYLNILLKSIKPEVIVKSIYGYIWHIWYMDIRYISLTVYPSVHTIILTKEVFYTNSNCMYQVGNIFISLAFTCTQLKGVIFSNCSSLLRSLGSVCSLVENQFVLLVCHFFLLIKKLVNFQNFFLSIFLKYKTQT